MEDGCYSDSRFPTDIWHKPTQYCDRLIKLMLIGDSGVGKTCVFTRFREGEKPRDIVEVTGGIIFKQLIFNVDSEVVKLQVWDVAGQLRYQRMSQMYYNNKDAFLLFYDVTDRGTFLNISKWLEGLNQYVSETSIFLIANKCDNMKKREVSQTEGQTLAAVYDLPYFETSAENGFNVSLIFEEIVRRAKNGHHM